MGIKKVCVFIGSRANYSSIKSAMRSIQNHPLLDLQLIVGASAVLDKYGSVAELIEEDGFLISASIHMLIDGETPVTMAKSTGLGLLEIPTILEQLKPDIVLVVGDRFEIMSAAVAAVYMNIPLAHTMGGEVTGTIDESIRHAVTKLSHIHFPANRDSAERIIKMGEVSEHVHIVGCPRVDIVAEVLKDGKPLNQKIFQQYGGVGREFDINQPFLLVSQHPVTTEYSLGEKQISQTLMATHEMNMPAIMIWPNADAGSEQISRGIRKFRETYKDNQIYLFKNLPMDVYIKLMNQTACLIGNSSSAIREGEFIGVPSVNIGSRQNGRERGANVLDVGNNKDEMIRTIQYQIEHGKYQTKFIYGDGKSGERIAQVLSAEKVEQQKRIAY
jgi:UDP-hydrolysing UDP-N-acetyl-D-glucosamine 2-epimerase